MLLILILVLIVILGYIWSYPYLIGTNYVIKMGYSAFWGIVIFIVFSSILKGSSCYLVFLVAFLAVGGLSFMLKKLFPNAVLFNNVTFSNAELCALFGVFFVYVLIYSRQTTLDTIFHFFFAEQIKLGKIPPSIHGFPQFPVKYHYGYDLLLGSLKTFTVVNYATLSSLLSLLLIFSNISIAAVYLKKRKFNNLLFTGSLILIFLGGGFFSIAKLIFNNEISSGLSLSSLFGQSSWVFGVAFLFLLLDFFSDFNLDFPKEALLKSIYLFPVLISAGLLTTSGYVLVVLAFVVFLVYLLLTFKLKNAYKILLYTGIYFILFYLINKKIGGMFIKGGYLEGPVYILAPIKVNLKIYLVRIAAYLFALAPIGLYAIYYLIKKYIKDPLLYFKVPLHDLFLNTVCLVLFCIPLIIWIENAAIWDNFCKFNNYGVLAAWIIFVDVIIRKLCERKTIKYRLIIVAVFLLLANESIIKVIRAYNGPNQLKAYTETIIQNRKLIETVRANIPMERRIYLLNRDLNGMYEVDRKTNDSKINLYKYINENFGVFDLIAKEAGRSVTNFFNFDSFLNRNFEYELWDILDGLYRGDPSVLEKLKDDYIISSISKLPDYTESWQKEERIQMMERSDEGDWVIYKVK